MVIESINAIESYYSNACKKYLSYLFRLKLDNKKATQSGFFISCLNKLACISFASVS